MALHNISNALRTVLCDAFVDAIDAGTTSGKLDIATDDSGSFNTGGILANLLFAGTAFGGASNGVATAAAIASDTSCNASGTAAWFRVSDGDDTVLFYGSVASGSGDIDFDSVSFSAGTTISIAASGTITMPASPA